MSKQESAWWPWRSTERLLSGGRFGLALTLGIMLVAVIMCLPIVIAHTS
jgi:hypothetical protein